METGEVEAPTAALSDDVLGWIFDMLSDCRHLSRCRGVCRRFCRVASLPERWLQFRITAFGGEGFRRLMAARHVLAGASGLRGDNISVEDFTEVIRAMPLLKSVQVPRFMSGKLDAKELPSALESLCWFASDLPAADALSPRFASLRKITCPISSNAELKDLLFALSKAEMPLEAVDLYCGVFGYGAPPGPDTPAVSGAVSGNLRKLLIRGASEHILKPFRHCTSLESLMLEFCLPPFVEVLALAAACPRLHTLRVLPRFIDEDEEIEEGSEVQPLASLTTLHAACTWPDSVLAAVLSSKCTPKLAYLSDLEEMGPLSAAMFAGRTSIARF